MDMAMPTLSNRNDLRDIYRDSFAVGKDGDWRSSRHFFNVEPDAALRIRYF
jgi:hypothetical protein